MPLKKAVESSATAYLPLSLQFLQKKIIQKLYKKLIDRSNSYHLHLFLTIKYILKIKHKVFLPAGIFSPQLKVAQHSSCFFLRIHHAI